jgi:AraC family transcriptional regulator of adaptative response / DNA-3-methyladenine glycosylase II
MTPPLPAAGSPGRGGTRQPRQAPPCRRRLRLPLPPFHDLDWMLGFLADRAAPALERVGAAGLVRAVRLDGRPVVLEIRPRPAPAAARWLDVEATCGGPPASAQVLRRLVRRMLDLDTDLAPFLALAAGDPLLAPLVARHPGLRMPQLPDPFEGAVRAIVGQQVSVAGARTVVDRLIRQFGDPAPGDHDLLAFPAAAAVAAAPLERLTALGLTRAKALALIAVAAASHDGSLDWDELRACSPESAQAALVALPGIGPWTASYIRMRALGDRDAFPASDLGVIKALARLLPDTADKRAGRAATTATTATTAAIAGVSERWRPWRAYATLHLWRSLSVPPR